MRLNGTPIATDLPRIARCATTVLAACALTAVGGCSSQMFCDAILIYQGLTVAVMSSNGAPAPAGTYAIAVVADGVALTATGTILQGNGFGFPTCPDPSCETTAPASDGRTLHVVLIPDFHPSGPGFAVNVYYTHGDFAGGPNQVTIGVSRDGVALGKVTFTPAYRRTEHPGSDCGFDTTSTAELELAGDGAAVPVAESRARD